MSILVIKDLHAEVDGKEILKGVNLEVNKGEVHAIMGPNGTGKSTLAAVIAGKDTFEVTQGDVLFNGKDILEMEPEAEDKAALDQDIRDALGKGTIELEDSIDIKEINNIKLANQLLKIKKAKREKKRAEEQIANINAQAEANARTAEKAAMAEVQKRQAIAKTEIDIETAKSQLKIKQLNEEARLKKELMKEEIRYNMQLSGLDTEKEQNKQKEAEDRKDERTRIQASQQSELIEQRKADSMPKNFESVNDGDLGGFKL